MVPLKSIDDEKVKKEIHNLILCTIREFQELENYKEDESVI